jgi:hypothetical protein
MSYEKEIMNKVQNGESLPDKLDLPVLKYLWEASPLYFGKKENYHEFFKKISVLSSFSDNEIRIFTNLLQMKLFLIRVILAMDFILSLKGQ